MFKHPKTAETLIQDPSPAEVSRRCIQCGACVSQCRFLSKHGTPGRMAEQYRLDPDACRSQAFECSQCGRCTAVCPGHLDPPAMFLKWRQEAVSSKRVDLSPFKGLLRYEKTGCSKTFSFYSLPEHCHTVFFPGCTLTGTRPEITLKTYNYLKNRIPGSGIVLDCCTKPSHDLGRKAFFEAMFSEMTGFLEDNRVTTVVTACPGCRNMFETHSGFRVNTIYEIMAEDPMVKNPVNGPMASPTFMENETASGTCLTRAVVQDPCQSRYDFSSQAAVRILAGKMGIELIESGESRDKTLCCGEGSAVGCISPETAGFWTRKRQAAARGKNTLTYCAGCVNRLSGPGRNLHILDLVFGRHRPEKISHAPFTYMNRLKLKKKLAKLPRRVTRERTFFHVSPAYGNGSPPLSRRLLIPGLIAGITVMLALALI